jgi:hypothetical protein
MTPDNTGDTGAGLVLPEPFSHRYFPDLEKLFPPSYIKPRNACGHQATSSFSHTQIPEEVTMDQVTKIVGEKEKIKGEKKFNIILPMSLLCTKSFSNFSLLLSGTANLR